MVAKLEEIIRISKANPLAYKDFLIFLAWPIRSGGPFLLKSRADLEIMLIVNI